MEDAASQEGAEALIVVQALICLLREKSLLSRSDIDMLSFKLDKWALATESRIVPCCSSSASQAAQLMKRLATAIGRRYGGKPSNPARISY